MATEGGTYSEGCIFSIDTNGKGYKPLLNFSGTNGSSPVSSLTLIGSKLYGTAFWGGLYDSGCIFSIDTNGYGYKDLFDFNGTNGNEPRGTLVLLGTTLYGVTLKIA